MTLAALLQSPRLKRVSAACVLIASVGIAMLNGSGRASEPTSYEFNYSKLEFREVPAKEFRPDFPPRSKEPGNVAADISSYLHANTALPRWMDAYSNLFYGGPAVDEALERAAASGSLSSESQARLDHLVSLRKGATGLSPLRSEKRPTPWRFDVGSRTDRKALGGFGSSDNFSRPIPVWLRTVQGQLTLVLRPDDLTAYDGQVRGKALYLANTRDEEVTFDARDSSLDLHCEAKAPDGSWITIDELPEGAGFCGNSFHRVFLPTNRCWKIAVPEYDGDYETVVRYRLNKGEQDEEVSNEIPMKIRRSWLDGALATNK